MIKKLLLNIIVNIICFIPLYAENGYLMQVKSFGFYNVFNSQIEFNEIYVLKINRKKNTSHGYPLNLLAIKVKNI